MKRPFLFGLFLFLCSWQIFSASLFAQSTDYQAQAWADSVLRRLSIEEKIGQLFMLATYSNKSEAEYQAVSRLIQQYHLGGLIFMQGNPEAQVKLINRYQKESNVPLLIAQDAEWGLSMRLKKVPSFPKNMTLGAIDNDTLLYRFGREVGRQCRLVGVNLNFAPVVDINNNPDNPVINYRSFGENKYNVARKGIMFSRGMQSRGVIACAKHFPGHGDTDVDSHLALPVIKHDEARLDTLELYPFTRMAQEGVGAMMVAHLHMPTLDPTPNQATTLSPKVVQQLLREKINYSGLIITDALNMHGVSKHYPAGEVALKAYQAGNDILLFPEDIPLSSRLIKESLGKGEISIQDLNNRVRRILRAKYKAGLHHWRPLPHANLAKDLFDVEVSVLRQQLYEGAMTLAKNEGNVVPIRRLDKRKIAYVQIGGAKGNPFYQTLAKYGSVSPFILSANFTSREQTQLLQQLRGFNTVVVGLFGMNQVASKRFGVSTQAPALTKALQAAGKETILTVFGSPYSLKYFGPEKAILVAYESVKDAQLAAAEALFGGIPITGRLPVTASTHFPEGRGAIIRKATRFGFAEPEQVGLDSRTLAQIDDIANSYIKKRAMPGCAILVMKKGRIVYEKGFGQTEYGRQGQRIHPYIHTYDLASVTKVAATTVSTMALAEKGMFSLDKPIGTYVPSVKGTAVARLTARRMLQHNAGLPNWLSLYQATFVNVARKQLDRRYYSAIPSSRYSVPIAPALYGSDQLNDLFIRKIREVHVKRTGAVKYTDIGPIITAMALENVSKRPLDQIATQLFYRRLGMNHTYFNPHKFKRAKYCPPTEADIGWRQAIIRGYVHDPNAAVLGGVAGHAGLFANVYDMAKLMYMLSNQGAYGGERYLQSRTIEQFTSRQLRYSRRGIGWDKSTPGQSGGLCSRYASPETFGHTGFTGTAVWVDPTNEIVYVFLSNRTYPNPDNRLLINGHVRTKIMDKIYEAGYAYKGARNRRYPLTR